MSIAGQYLLILGADGTPINGESSGTKSGDNKLKYLDSIDIRSWDWSVADQTSTAGSKTSSKTSPKQSSGSGAAGTAETGLLPELFKFTKGVDASTTRLMRAMDKNERMQRARFVLHEERVTGANDGHKEFVLEVILDDVYVVGYSLQGRAAEARVDLDESWEFHYKTIKVEYKSAGGLNVEFERKAGAERGSDDKATANLNAKLDKTMAMVEKMKRQGGG